jgi:hypothetical protein
MRMVTSDYTPTTSPRHRVLGVRAGARRVERPTLEPCD